MTLKDFDWIDPSKRASEHLNQILDQRASAHGITTPQEAVVEGEGAPLFNREDSATVSYIDSNQDTEVINVDEARTGGSVLERAHDRHRARLLVITRDETVLTEGSIAYHRLTDTRSYFMEVHVLVLNVRAKSEEEIPTIRPFENVWIYPTNASSWWALCYLGYKVAESQLEFGGGFRADFIVAEDPFESGMVAKFLASHYERLFQLHLYEDFFDPTFIETHNHPMLYSWCSRYTLQYATSVRTKTEFQRQAAIHINKNLEGKAELLPTYFALNAWRDTIPVYDLHLRYPQFKFILLHISSMRKKSCTNQVISGVSAILKRYTTIGLVIVGSGPLRSLYEKQVIAHGIQKQVEFEPMPLEIISHIKSANVFIHLSEEGSEDESILMAAVSKVPLILNKNGIGGKLFKNGESAILCSPNDVSCVADGVNRYLNENQDRTRFALEAYETVFNRVEQDHDGYLKAYALSIQRSAESES